MKTFIDNIKGFFNNTKPVTSTSSSTLNKVNQIIFEVTENEDVKIKLNFALTSDDASESLGVLLHELTTGAMSQSILDIMLDLSKEYPGHADLVKKSILIWITEFTKLQNSQNSKITINEDDSPIIQPTEFSSTRGSS